jgi:hypothetical protein
MTFYKHLENLFEFLASVRRLENFVSFDINFPSTWGLPKSLASETQIVPFETQDENKKGISFVCEFNEADVDKTVNIILKVIRLNKEREMKDRLFKEVVANLKKTFETNDLTTLEKLQIGFDIENIKEEEEEENEATGTESIGLGE